MNPNEILENLYSTILETLEKSFIEDEIVRSKTEFICQLSILANVQNVLTTLFICHIYD